MVIITGYILEFHQIVTGSNVEAYALLYENRVMEIIPNVIAIL